MFTKLPAVPDCQETVSVSYQLLEPIEMVLETSDGHRATHGFGIGEVIEVLEPRTTLLVASYLEKSSIDLADGRRIVSWPHAARHNRLW